MKNLLEDLLERAAAWSDEAQAELVEAMLEIEAKHSGVYRLNDDERAAVRRGLEEVRQGKFASEADVRAVFDRYRRG